MQLRAAQTSLEPLPHRVSRTGRGAVREPEHQTATAADSRASPPRSAPEDPRSPDSQPRSKQVADYECADCQARVLLEMRILSNSGAQNYHLYMPLSWWSGLEPEPAAPPAGALAGSAAPGSCYRSAPPAAAAARRSAKSLADRQAEDAGRPGRRRRCAAGRDVPVGPGRGAGTPSSCRRVRPGPVRVSGRARRRPGRWAGRGRSPRARKAEPARSAGWRELGRAGLVRARRCGT